MGKPLHPFPNSEKFKCNNPHFSISHFKLNFLNKTHAVNLIANTFIPSLTQTDRRKPNPHPPLQLEDIFNHSQEDSISSSASDHQTTQLNFFFVTASFTWSHSHLILHYQISNKLEVHRERKGITTQKQKDENSIRRKEITDQNKSYCEDRKSVV
jgi:hypothetical protein